jgi:hypothetical protein
MLRGLTLIAISAILLGACAPVDASQGIAITVYLSPT